MLRPALRVKRIDLQPAVVNGEAGCPDDRRDAGLSQVQFKNRMDQALGVRPDVVGFGFRRQVQAIAGGKGVGFIQN